jgi:hypothetical protein
MSLQSVPPIIQNPEHRWRAIEAQRAEGHPDAAELDDVSDLLLYWLKPYANIFGSGSMSDASTFTEAV